MNEEELFHQVLDQPPLQREAFLDAACRGDAGLRARIQSLLQAHAHPGSFLQGAADAAFAPTTANPVVCETPGTVIGPYKLLEKIGEGGFGVVFMAEQTAPVKRKVALKVIKPGMDTRQVIARFEAERQALALMDHPHIARVFDAGATDTGRPYFVMELVRGVPITTYCDQVQLPPRQRLELFLSVCQAVQHAHQKGIIHRDIKPSNILVTQHDDQPVVKVIDFGIAKVTSGQLTDKTLFTGFAQMIGTPLYMSPEQASLTAIDVDTRSDIYSLGVLLYELLTGTTPFDKERLQQAAYEEIRRIIREEEPQKPSTRLSSLGHALPSVSAVRRMEPRKLSQFVRGDLDWIVMKALEKDRARRYETANGFAADVLRYLSDEPVTACPPSAGYRFRKFVQRNKATVTVAVVMLLLLLGGTIGTTVGLFRAEHAEQVARQRAESERQAKLDAQAREQETQAVLRFVEQNLLEADTTAHGQPTLDRDTVLALLDKTLSLKVDQLGANHPDTVRTKQAIAASYRDRSQQLCAAGQYADSAASYRKALELDPRDAWQWYQAACVSLYTGDEDHYHKACRILLDRAANTNDTQLMEWTSRACTMTPNAVANFPALERIAERSVQGTEQHQWYRNFVLGKAATEYRAGHYDSAVHWLARFAPTVEGTCWDATALAIGALAHDRLGNAGKAREMLAAAQDIVAVKAANEAGARYWFDWLQSEIFLREAERQLQVRLVDRSQSQAVDEAQQRIRSRQLLSLSDVIALHPGSRQAVTARALWLLDNGRFEAAQQDLERLHLMGDPDVGRWQIRAALLAYANRDADYEACCQRMMHLFGTSVDPADLDRTTKSLMLTPRCVVLDSAAILQRANREYELSQNSPWALLLMGMAELRHGRHEQAVPWLQKCIQSPDDGFPARTVIAESYLAIAQHQLGQTEASRATLENLERRASRDLQPVHNGNLRAGGIENWLHAHLALREARMHVAGSPQTPLVEASGPAVPPLPPLMTAPAPFRGTPAVIPGVVQAEDFDEGGQGIAYYDTDAFDTGNEKRRPRYRLEAVDVDDCPDVGGGLNIGGLYSGEWLTYTVHVEEAGDYIVSVRFASPGGGLVRFTGTDQAPLCEIALPATGWNNWNTATSQPVRLAAGPQVLRVTFTEPKNNYFVCNLNWFALNRAEIADSPPSSDKPDAGSKPDAPAR